MHKNCPTKLQVSNLSKDTSHREIEAWLAGSRVTGAIISKKKDSYILEFESAAQAQRAKEILSKNTYINGNVCKVAHYREFMAVGEATVVVQGLTPDSNFIGIEQVIRQFPGVTEVSFKKKTTKPYAFVSFERMDQANLFIKELHGSWVHGDFLRIFIVSENSSNNSSPNLLGSSNSAVTSPNLLANFSPNVVPALTSPNLPHHIPSSASNSSPAAGSESPNTRRLRSTSLNAQISFDAFLDNISNNFNLLNFVSPPATTSPSPTLPTTKRAHSFNTNYTPAYSLQNSPQYQSNPQFQNNPQYDHRKNRSKSLGTKVYVPLNGNSIDDDYFNGVDNQGNLSDGSNGLMSPPLIPDPSFPVNGKTPTNSLNTNSMIPNINPNVIKPPTPAIPTTSPTLTPAPTPTTAPTTTTTATNAPTRSSFTRGHVRKRSVSFDSNINTIIDAPLFEPPNNTDYPAISLTSPNSPNNLNNLNNLNNPNSPTTSANPIPEPNRVRSQSVGGGNTTVVTKTKGATAKTNPNDLFVRPTNKTEGEAADELGEDNASNESKDVSPSGSVSGNLSTSFSLSNLPHRNNYFTLRLENLDEEVTSTILYDLFNCVLEEPPSLLSAKAVRGQGFVDFDNQEMATLARTKLHGRKFMGNTLQISLLRPEDKCVLKVTNLPFSTDEKDLEEHFSDIAGLISANIVRKATGISKGFAFLVFVHFSAAEKALQEKHGTIVQGRPINIRFHNGGNNQNNPNNPNRKNSLKGNPSTPSTKTSRPGISSATFDPLSDIASESSSTNATPIITPDSPYPLEQHSGPTTPTGAPMGAPAFPMAPPPGFAAYGAVPHHHAAHRKSEHEGERPDDAAFNSYQLTDEEVERCLSQFNLDLSFVIQKILANDSSHSQRKDRLRQNAQLLEAIRTKLAEKKLEQLNDDLIYSKHKQTYLHDTHSLSSSLSSSSLSSSLSSASLSLPLSPSPLSPEPGLSDGDQMLGDLSNGLLSDPEKERYQAKKIRSLKQASSRKIIEELGDQMKLARMIKDIEEERQTLEDQRIQLELIEIINSVAEKVRKVPISKLQQRIQQAELRTQDKMRMKEEFQRVQDLKRSYDIDLDSSSPPRTMSISAWPNDEAVKIDTFQLYFTDDHFSLRCCNIQLTRASIRPRPFGRGTNHLSYWIKLASDPPKTIKVAKAPIAYMGPDTDKESCMQDITTQLYASSAAKIFSEKKLAKVVEYAPIQLLCFYQRTPQIYMTIEPAIEGIWKRYNNNSGLIDVERNSFIQAFSHFSYDHSHKKMMVTDLQGTKNQNKYVFTDPLVHCLLDDTSFGKSNLGQAGIDEFFRSHVCNRICRSLHLSQHHLQPNDGAPVIS